VKLRLTLNNSQARRSFFAFATKPEKEKISAKEMVERSRRRSDDNDIKMKHMNQYFEKLASPKNMNKEIPITEDSEIRIAEYQIACDEIVEASKALQEQERIELTNRAYKATRLAGVYAFIDGSDEIKVEHIEQAIYVAELSGLAFQKVCNQPPIFERIFNFIKNRTKTSDVDLAKQNWFKGSSSQKRELLQLARAFAYENDYLFKIKEVESVEFYSFIPMPKTDVDNITISISKDITKGFKKKKVPFEILHEVVCNPEFNYSAGTFKKGYRNKDNYEKKQNLVIIDIDDGMKLETAKKMFSNYKCLIAATRSHQIEKNGTVCDRFRLIFITDRTIQLDSDTYGRFMSNVYASLGVPADESCKDSSRAYFGAKREYWYSSGDKLLEISDLIPDTSREKERRVMLSSSGIGSTLGVERVLLESAVVGSRNDACIKWALFIKDSGYSFEDAKDKVLDFNSKLPEPLTKRELEQTVLSTLKRKY